MHLQLALVWASLSLAMQGCPAGLDLAVHKNKNHAAPIKTALLAGSTTDQANRTDWYDQQRRLDDDPAVFSRHGACHLPGDTVVLGGDMVRDCQANDHSSRVKRSEPQKMMALHWILASLSAAISLSIVSIMYIAGPKATTTTSTPLDSVDEATTATEPKASVEAPFQKTRRQRRKRNHKHPNKHPAAHMAPAMESTSAEPVRGRVGR